MTLSPPPDATAAPGLRESKKERTRAALVEAALELACEHGYESTTVEAIARRADVSVRTLHNYFPGKAAVFAHRAVLVFDEYTAFLADQPDSLTCSDALCEAWLAMLEAHQPDLAMLRTMLDVLDSHAEVKAHLTEATPGATEALRAEIARRIGHDPDTSIIPWFALMLCFGAPALVLRAGDFDIPGADRPEALLREAFSSLTVLSTPAG